MSKKYKKQTDYWFRIEREIEKGLEKYYLFVKFERMTETGVKCQGREIGQVWFFDELSNTLNLKLREQPTDSGIFLREDVCKEYTQKYRTDFRAILHEWGVPVEVNVRGIYHLDHPVTGGMVCQIEREIHTGQVGVVWDRHSAWHKKKWYRPAMEFLKNMIESEMSSYWRRRFKEGPTK